jgi:hypothetical protein
MLQSAVGAWVGGVVVGGGEREGFEGGGGGAEAAKIDEFRLGGGSC